MGHLVDDEAYDEYRIPEVKTPQEDLEDALEYAKELSAVFKKYKSESPRRDDRLFDFGRYERADAIPDDELPEPPNALFVTEWVQRFNEAISGLNVVMHDLVMIRDNPLSAGRPLSVRLTFLVRSYTNEFFRMKELFSYFSKAYYKSGIITKPELKELRSAYYGAFEGMIKFRNSLLHKPGSFQAKQHADLVQLEAMWEGGNAVKDEETGEFETGERQVQELCERYLEPTSQEGRRISEATSKLMEIFSEMLRIHDSQQEDY